MSTATRTLVALPIAAAAVALFVATSPPDEWFPWELDSVRETITTDNDGLDDGLIRVVMVGPIRSDSELRITLINDDARGSLLVGPTDGSAAPGKVKDGYEIFRGLPNACEQFETAEGPLRSCTIEVPVQFEGRPNQSDEVTIQGAIGAWSYSDVRADDEPYSVEIDYDADPPARE